MDEKREKRDALLTEYYEDLPPRQQLGLIRMMSRLQEPFPSAIRQKKILLPRNDTFHQPVAFPKELLWLQKNIDYYRNRGPPLSLRHEMIHNQAPPKLAPEDAYPPLPQPNATTIGSANKTTTYPQKRIHYRSIGLTATRKYALSAPSEIEPTRRSIPQQSPVPSPDSEVKVNQEPGDFVCCTVKHCLSGSFKCEKKRNWEEAQEISRAQGGLKEPKDEPFDEANIIMAETTAGGGLEDVKPEPLGLDALPAPAPENDESVYRVNARHPLSYEPSPDLPPNDITYAMTRICRGCDLPLSQKEFSAHFLLISQGVKCPEAKCNDLLINCPYPDCIAKGFGSMTNYANHLRLHHGRPTFIREFAYTDIAEYRTHLNEIRAMGDYENDKHTKLSGRTYPCRYTHDPNDSDDEFDDCDLSHKQPIACGAFYHGAVESRNLTGSPIIHLRVCNLHIHGKMKIPRALRHRIRQLARFMPIPILIVIIRAESGKYAGEGGLLQQILELDALKIGRIIHKGGIVAPDFDPTSYKLPPLKVFELLRMPEHVGPSHIRNQCAEWVVNRKNQPVMNYRALMPVDNKRAPVLVDRGYHRKNKEPFVISKFLRRQLKARKTVNTIRIMAKEATLERLLKYPDEDLHRFSQLINKCYLAWSAVHQRAMSKHPLSKRSTLTGLSQMPEPRFDRGLLEMLVDDEDDDVPTYSEADPWTPPPVSMRKEVVEIRVKQEPMSAEDE